MKVSDHVVLPVASFRLPKMYGPAIAAALPTPSIAPKAVESRRVGKSSEVYGETPPQAPRLKKPTKKSAVMKTPEESATAKAYAESPPRNRNVARVGLRPIRSTSQIAAA